MYALLRHLSAGRERRLAVRLVMRVQRQTEPTHQLAQSLRACRRLGHGSAVTFFGGDCSYVTQDYGWVACSDTDRRVVTESGRDSSRVEISPMRAR